MQIRRYTNHVADGLKLLLSQYKGRPRIKGWLSAYLRGVQRLEDAAYDVIVRRMIDIATGAQLDALGRIVKEHRQGKDDDEYRVFIHARVRINRSMGRFRDLLEVLAMVSETPVLADEYYPAAMLFEFTEIPDRDPELLSTMLRDTKAGGVWLGIVAPTADDDHRFLYSSVGDADSPTNGYGDANDPDEFGLLSDGVRTPR